MSVDRLVSMATLTTTMAETSERTSIPRETPVNASQQQDNSLMPVESRA
jgi:hypothetical protein